MRVAVVVLGVVIVALVMASGAMVRMRCRHARSVPQRRHRAALPPGAGLDAAPERAQRLRATG